ncbi:T9SS type A sorting domain-containing protein [Salegentibacter maritimus]|uniref:T9SS type A sorting domain-containing protein n=1 Tax=Salegentibacter maritimus TaxID=2794347 RepID=A0ABS0TD87_9FLAO|nr:T9SS type A sorting domain-containing protein [Salegentibacter maritimus]MBI6119017.1 T9SS type A sorting domain-containing protein [Salegentibacter maritimus]
MRQIYFLAFIFSFSYGNAQLYIAPSQTGDSYIYLSDRLLYVEDNINLEKNHSPDTEASIYLRKESQLLQGVKSTNNNSGNGWISVFQEGTSNAFDYNYWSLPVSNNISANQFGAVIFQPKTKTRSLPALITNNLEGSANPLKISTRWIYKFSGSSYEDWTYIGNNFDVKPGEGFTMKGVNGSDHNLINGIENNPGNRQRYDFRGLPNDGEIKVQIKNNKSVLVGNPYPSALHLQSFLLENPNSTGIAYFWDSRDNGNSHYLKDYEGGYGSYSPGANAYAPAVFKTYNDGGAETGNSGANGKHIAREYSPIGQAFMLTGKSDGYISFKNSHRRFQKENNLNSEFKNQQRNEFPLLKLNVNFNDLYTRKLLLAFREDSSKEEDWAMDAKIYGMLDNDAGWNIAEALYNIQVRPFRKNDKIPLYINLSEASKLSFSMENIQGFKAKEIFVFDAYLETYNSISENEFTIDLEKGNYSTRFFISFMQEKEYSPLPKENEVDLEITSPEVIIAQNNSLSQLEVKMLQANLKQILLYNLNGQMIFKQNIAAGGKGYKLSTSGIRDAIYIVKVISSENLEFTSKISIKN